MVLHNNILLLTWILMREKQILPKTGIQPESNQDLIGAHAAKPLHGERESAGIG